LDRRAAVSMRGRRVEVRKEEEQEAVAEREER
jgi:hypothetical protein